KDVAITIIACRICSATGSCGSAGQVIETASKDGIIVAAGQGSLAISRLKPAGGRILTAQEFINGYRLKKGDRFA
ncbi:MAG: methionyl-tRNA formyltransferase, partial [Planctomycetes bacterium]|nr:methionyl-tRNA formyltransferase [Planctomycetota bacterium]